MKKIGQYTTRGFIISDNAVNRIQLFDGSFKTGYRVTGFKLAPSDMDSTSARLYTAKLMTDDNAATGINWNWENNEEIAWACVGYDGNDVRLSGDQLNTVDPENLVIEDLFIVCDEGVTSSSDKVNYMITLEKYEFNEWKGALSMVRNRSQA